MSIVSWFPSRFTPRRFPALGNEDPSWVARGRGSANAASASGLVSGISNEKKTRPPTATAAKETKPTVFTIADDLDTGFKDPPKGEVPRRPNPLAQKALSKLPCRFSYLRWNLTEKGHAKGKVV